MHIKKIEKFMLIEIKLTLQELNGFQKQLKCKEKLKKRLKEPKIKIEFLEKN